VSLTPFDDKRRDLHEPPACGHVGSVVKFQP
jgi:hypothetical protein